VRSLALVHGIVGRQTAPLDPSMDRIARLAELVAWTGIVPPGSVIVCVASRSVPGSGPNLVSIDRLPAVPGGPGS
jgi:hypothetical protein